MTEALRCPGCGTEVHDDWRFCMECGTERPGLYQDVPSDQPPQPEDELPGGALVRWRGVDALAAFALSFFATVIVIAINTMMIGDEPTQAQTDTGTIIAIFSQQVTLIGATLIWLRRRFGLGVEALGLRRFNASDLKIGVAGGAIGVVLSAAVAWTVMRMTELVTGDPPPDPDQIPLEADPSGGLLVLLAISTIVLAPLAEELFFRGMLHQALRRWLRFAPGLIMSSALFAVSHVIPVVIPSIFVLALLLGTLYERTKSLWVPIVAHATFNVVGYTFTFLA